MVFSPAPSDQVIVFMRYPQAGCVKTRLVPKLGKEGAARFYRNMVEHIVAKISPVATEMIQLSLYYTGASPQQMTSWLGDSFPFMEQQGDNLGARMLDAFQTSKNNNFRRTILIGSDCPAIDPALINQGFRKLLTHDLVLGPTFDGGYYLIGLTGKVSDEKIGHLFSEIKWGTGTVYRQSVAKAKAINLSLATLPKHNDIDRPEDLEHFNYYSNS